MAWLLTTRCVSAVLGIVSHRSGLTHYKYRKKHILLSFARPIPSVLLLNIMSVSHVYTSAKVLPIKISHHSIKLLDTKNTCICGSAQCLRAVFYRIIQGAD